MQYQIAGRAAHNAEIQDRAEKSMAEIGVDAAFIDLLVETFTAVFLNTRRLALFSMHGLPGAGRNIWPG